VNLKVIFPVISVSAFIIWYFLIDNGLYAVSSDETSRTLISYYWHTSGKIESSSWLPLHFLIMGWGLILFQDLIWLPRIISLLFGIMTIAAAGLLADELFRKKEITIYTLIIMLLIPQRVILSIVPLPEIIFSFFVISGSLFFLKFIRSGGTSHLIISVVLITLSNSLRYEGWIISACMGVYLLWKFKGQTRILFVLSLLAIFPLFWLLFNYLKFDDIFYFLHEPGKYYALAQEETFFNTLKFNPLTQFIEQNLITMNILGLAGIYLLRKNALLRRWMIVFFLPLILFSAVSLTGKGLPAHNFWRTSVVWVFILIPFTSFMIFKLKRLAAVNPSVILILFILPLQVIFSNNHYFKNIREEYCLTQDKIDTANKIIEYLNSTAGSEDRILIENLSTFEHFDITLASQEPFRFIYSRRNDLTPLFEEKYTGVVIRHYLVKSSELREKLTARNYIKAFEKNGWGLYIKKDDISEEVR
jgi:hypothetical protein